MSSHTPNFMGAQIISIQRKNGASVRRVGLPSAAGTTGTVTRISEFAKLDKAIYEIDAIMHSYDIADAHNVPPFTASAMAQMRDVLRRLNSV